MSDKQRTIIISGGSKGLGSALVSRCLHLGYQVATFSRKPSDFINQATIEDPEQTRFIWRATDIAHETDVRNFVNDVLQKFGRIDALINNVGTAIEGILPLIAWENIAKCVDFNIKGTILLTQLCSKAMLKQREGSIVNISSVNAIRGHSGVAVYSATKAALDGFTRSLAREFGQMNIRVNSIAPGYFESDMVADLSPAQKLRIIRRTPLGRLPKINEIVNGILFMISPESSFITGQTLVIDGGITC